MKHCTAKLYSWTASFSVKCKRSCSIIIGTGSYLYVVNTCTFHLHEDVQKSKNVLNEELSLLYQWFIDHKLSIHFGEVNSKSVPFSKAKALKEINICFSGRCMKQHKRVPWLKI